MERSVITRAKNAEIAVDEALKLLAVPRESVQIEIVDPGGRGMLGLGNRLTVVKVTVLDIPAAQTPAAPSSAQQELAPETLETASSGPAKPVASYGRADEEAARETQEESGEIAIVNGRFRIAASGGRLPLLTPPAGAVLLKNGVPVGSKVSVAPGDELELDTSPIAEPPVWRIELDEACLRAEMHVKPGFERRFSLVDSKAQPHLTVPVTETRALMPIDEAEVRGRLKDMGVVFGIRAAAIAEACRSEHPGTFVVAEGAPAVQGEDGKFDTNFETETKRTSPKSREDGTIDYREIVEFPTVIEGQVLVRTLPAKPGRPGRDVMDRPILPRQVQSIALAAGEGVSVSEDGRRAVAMRQGMPRIKQQGYRVHLSVLPKLEHRGDVDLKSGNIRFRGDVEISGGVQNGMKVEAFGSIAIRGAVSGAAVDASYSLIASGSLIGAQVNVGRRSEFLDQVEPLMLEIASQTQLLQSAIEQLSQTAAFKLNDIEQGGLGALLSVLLRGKFKGLHSVLSRFVELAAKNETQMDEEWKEYAGSLKFGFLDLRYGGFRNAAELDAFRRRTLEITEGFCGPQDRPVFAELQYTHNSHIYCGGDVRIGKGAYNATIYCQGKLETAGTLRGGVYFAAKGMNVKEVGAPGGVSTKLQVPEKSAIRAARVLEGTVVQIGRRSFQFVEAASNVHARLGSREELLLF
ncbi:FapA family protein [Saccharibacillus sp. O23]|uniref:FapA family protein n=1 Tax=Saccharibacillus sp. O23 TaxID=2009338 RepID=UPI0015C5BA80|nr:FapA family protein [Saccharibacillus sp. O23]